MQTTEGSPAPPVPPRHEPPYALIRDGLRDAKVIPFLGAGASFVRRSGAAAWSSPADDFLPMAGELAEYLNGRSGFPSTEAAELARVAQYFDGVAGRGSLDDHLHQIFARRYEPGPLHRYLASFPRLLAVTTNYDGLLETALRDAGRRFRLVVYKAGASSVLVWDDGAGLGEPREEAANELDLGFGKDAVIFKMHGAPDPVDEERDSYVITEDDYVEFLARLANKTAIPACFAEPFRRRHFLFLGYGLRDWNLRVILYQVWKEWPRRRYASWAIQHETEPLEREFWNRKQLMIYEMTIADFLARLAGEEDGD